MLVVVEAANADPHRDGRGHSFGEVGEYLGIAWGEDIVGGCGEHGHPAVEVDFGEASETMGFNRASGVGAYTHGCRGPEAGHFFVVGVPVCNAFLKYGAEQIVLLGAGVEEFDHLADFFDGDGVTLILGGITSG